MGSKSKDKSKKITDVQNLADYRGLEIDKVGIKNIKYPIAVLDKQNGTQHTVANINLYVNLPHNFKGTHMSRFVEILNQYRRKIDAKSIPEILREMKQNLNAESAHLEIEFPYFVEKRAPITNEPSLMEYICRFVGSLKKKLDLVVELEVPIATLCPCSKEISDKSAHNQRGVIKVAYRANEFVWIEDIIKLVETSGSSEVYALLKREDEKFITEHAYDNPRFVEDVVREVAQKMLKKTEITWFSVEAENFESIHNHSAYAFIECDKKKKGNNT